MKLEQFLELDNPEKYDLSGEYATEQYNNCTPCEKYIIYKAYTISNEWKEIFSGGREFSANIKKTFTKKKGREVVNWIGDPDSLDDPDSLNRKVLHDIYMKLWPFMFDNSNNKFWSDTMSSVQYTMSDLFELYVENKDVKMERKRPGYKQNCTIRYMIDYFSKVSDSQDVNEKVSLAAKEIEIIPFVNKMLGAWHTLGNFCPVPRRVNSPRSNYGKHDMWDLTLMKIRQWYLCHYEIVKEKILVEDLFHFNRQADIENMTRWLSYFGDGESGWGNFVDTFMFQDWVNTDESNPERYYEVLPLCENHDWEYAYTPFDNIETFINNYENRIYLRGKRIIEKLRE